MYKDSEHIIVPSVKFTNGAELHRFVNPGGSLYSAIYHDGYEEMNCERKYEQGMIAKYQSMLADGII